MGMMRQNTSRKTGKQEVETKITVSESYLYPHPQDIDREVMCEMGEKIYVGEEKKSVCEDVCMDVCGELKEIKERWESAIERMEELHEEMEEIREEAKCARMERDTAKREFRKAFRKKYGVSIETLKRVMDIEMQDIYMAEEMGLLEWECVERIKRMVRDNE